MDRAQSVLIHGHFGMRNVGDDAMLEAIVAALRRKNSNMQIAVCAGPDVDREFFAKESLTLVPRTIYSLATNIPRHSTFLIGGGTHLHSKRGKWRYLEDAVNQFLLLLYARFFGRRCEMIGVGFGRFETRSGDLVARACCKLSAFISVRDDESMLWLQEHRKQARYHKTVDPVYFLPKPHSRRRQGRLILSALPYFRNYDAELGGDRDRKFVAGLCELVQTWLDLEPNNSVCLVVFNSKECSDNDELVLRAVMEPFKASGRVEWFGYDPRPDRVLAQFFNCSHAVVTRYHSAVFAHLAGVPMLSINYHQKNISFCTEIGVSQQMQVTPECVVPGASCDLARRLFDKSELAMAAISAEDYSSNARPLLDD